MAQNKKSFILYADIISTFEELKDAEAGRLIKHLLRYVNDLHPQAPDKLTKVVFEPIKQQLKRDLVEWNAIKQERSNGGKLGNLKRWNNDLYIEVINDKMSIEEAENIAKGRRAILTDRTPSHKVANVAVNDTVTVTVKKESKEKNNFPLTDLGKSNLFREPSIPTFEQVEECFLSNAGTKEMAKKFYATYEAVGWYFKNTPITNFKNLVYSFVENWKKNLKKDFTEPSAPPLKNAANAR